jgi:hypothetical protein
MKGTTCCPRPGASNGFRSERTGRRCIAALLDGDRAGAASPADWEQAAPRVARYLRALGVRDPRDLDRLLTAIRGRFEHQVETTLVADAVETGIEEASKLLDEWLAAELGPDVPGSDARGVARAVV